MITPVELVKERIDAIIGNDSLDMNFDSVCEHISTLEEFDEKIRQPFNAGDKQLFYRGERIADGKRRLVPTILRDISALPCDNDIGIIHIDSDYIFDFYSSMGKFVDVFSKTMGRADSSHLYELCAFAQHYHCPSPLIDFSKNLYTSLSFALKGREVYDEDIVLFVVGLKNPLDYTKSSHVADTWLKNINVYASRFDEEMVKKNLHELVHRKNKISFSNNLQYIEELLDFLSTHPAPKAKLIDVPTNTRMKFQQGVFLLLTDFQVYNGTYFTKNIREHFDITKFIISKDICPKLKNMIDSDAPWYSYDCLMDIEGAFKKAINQSADKAAISKY
ncbi:MAG: FRG domain-containing protein [Clostridiales bacterium]|nr:FRG domain-containing protein [Clostridiales bacterium]